MDCNFSQIVGIHLAIVRASASRWRDLDWWWCYLISSDGWERGGIPWKP